MVRQGITWRSWADGSTGGPIAAAWGVRDWPSIYVLDGRGVIRYRRVSAEHLDEAVEKLLRER